MGVFVGIISGFAGGVIYNKYYNYRKLPDALAFFNGKRFVPMVVIAWSVIIPWYWPLCGRWCRPESTPLACGLPIPQPHPPYWRPLSTEPGTSPSALWPSSYADHTDELHILGGTYTILTGVNAGSQVFGQDPLWLAWATDLINLQNAGDITGYQNLLTAITPARFKVGQMIGATGLLLGIALAMYAVWMRINAAATAPCSSPPYWPYS